MLRASTSFYSAAAAIPSVLQDASFAAPSFLCANAA